MHAISRFNTYTQNASISLSIRLQCWLWRYSMSIKSINISAMDKLTIVTFHTNIANSSHPAILTCFGNSAYRFTIFFSYYLVRRACLWESVSGSRYVCQMLRSVEEDCASCLFEPTSRLHQRNWTNQRISWSAPLFHWVATLGKLFTHIAFPVSQLQETGVQKGSLRRLSGYGDKVR